MKMLSEPWRLCYAISLNLKILSSEELQLGLRSMREKAKVCCQLRICSAGLIADLKASGKQLNSHRSGRQGVGMLRQFYKIVKCYRSICSVFLNLNWQAPDYRINEACPLIILPAIVKDCRDF